LIEVGVLERGNRAPLLVGPPRLVQQVRSRRLSGDVHRGRVFFRVEAHRPATCALAWAPQSHGGSPSSRGLRRSWTPAKTRQGPPQRASHRHEPPLLVIINGRALSHSAGQAMRSRPGVRWLVRPRGGRRRTTPRDGWPAQDGMVYDRGRDGGRHPARRTYGRRPVACACSVEEGTRRTPCPVFAVGVIVRWLLHYVEFVCVR